MAKGKPRKKTRGKEAAPDAAFVQKDAIIVSSSAPADPHDEFLAYAGVYDHGNNIYLPLRPQPQGF
jgi:hypothetical protein